MHERKVMDDLVEELDRISRREGAPIERITVKLGALSHFTPEHFREHFVDATAGTGFSAIKIDAEQSEDVTDEHADGVVLESVVVAG